MTHRCIELVKHFEGFRPHIYICPAGYPTIGYGHVVTPEERKIFANGITKEEAEFYLIRDLLKIQKAILPLIAVTITPLMLDALVSFTFNVGVYAFRSSTLRRKLNRMEYYDVADEFLRWVYAGGRILKGLIRRRQAERALYLEGVDQLWLVNVRSAKASATNTKQGDMFERS